jgi:hypothetical protein
MDPTLAHTNVPRPKVGPGWEVAGVAEGTVIWRNQDSFQMAAWWMYGSDFYNDSWTIYPSVAKDGSWKVAAVGRFAGDLLDLLWRRDDGSMALWVAQSGSSEIGLATVSDPNWQVATPR